MFEAIKGIFASDQEPQLQVQPPEQANKDKKRDMLVAGAFVAAIAVLLGVAGYVISRISSDTTYKKKWEDYEDCGWA